MIMLSDWFTKNREWLITVAVLLIFVALLGLSGMYFKNGKKEIPLPAKIVDEVEIDLTDNGEQPNAKNSSSQDNSAPPQTTSFFLKPSPDELIEKLENLTYHEFKKESRDLPGLRVIWPAYFFAVMSNEGEWAQVMFDAKENGFGVIISAEINTSQYPQILTMQRGKKLWIAGEIVGVDPEGTGRFFIKAEYLRFDDPRQAVRSLEKTQAN